MRILDRLFIGNGMKPREVRATLRRVSGTASGQSVGGSRGHARGFVHRHPDLSYRMAERTKGPRIMGPTRKGHDHFFDNCELAGLANEPASMVIDIDESDVQSKIKKVNVLGPRFSIVKRVTVPDSSVSMHDYSSVPFGRMGCRMGSPFTFCLVRTFLWVVWMILTTTT